MDTLTGQLLVFVMLINFVLLGTNQLAFAVRAVAVQGVILGIIPGLLHPFSGHLLTITTIIIFVKGVLIPYFINQAISKARIKREMEPFIGYLSSLLLGGVFTALAFVFAHKLPLAAEHKDLLIVPASIATLATGFLVITTRKKAISQVIGYLVMENGIFIFGMLLTDAMPFMVEAGALLDLLVGVFVMGIVINQISREYASIDTSRLQALREE